MSSAVVAVEGERDGAGEAACALSMLVDSLKAAAYVLDVALPIARRSMVARVRVRAAALGFEAVLPLA